MIHKYLVDDRNQKSMASRMRKQRFKILLSMIKDLKISYRKIQILDIGGTPEYWDIMLSDFSGQIHNRIQITLLNPKTLSDLKGEYTIINGDGTSMPEFSDKQFDIVFSNSTIEHTGSYRNQLSMAKEIKRVGQKYYIQTPNRYFPIEPHFVFPFFQFFPEVIQLWLVKNFSLGWYPKIKDRQKALDEITSIRLLCLKEFRNMFPEAVIYKEKFCSLTKSFIAYTV